MSDGTSAAPADEFAREGSNQVQPPTAAHRRESARPPPLRPPTISELVYSNGQAVEAVPADNNMLPPLMIHPESVNPPATLAAQRPEVAIRAGTRRDIPQLRYLHNRSFPLVYDEEYYDDAFKSQGCCIVATTRIPVPPPRHGPCNGFAGRPSAANIPECTEPLPAPDSDGTYEHLIGFAIGRVKEHEGIFSSSLEGYIATIGVLEDFKKAGIGSRVLQGLEDVFRQRGCRNSYLHMLTTNYPAMNFYAKNGYTTQELLENYYDIDGGQFDAFVLRKPLSKQTYFQQRLEESSSLVLRMASWFGLGKK